MAVFVPNASELVFLNHLLKVTSPPALTLHLYSNNYTPTDSTVLSDLTETTVSGYSSKVLTRSGWNDSTTIDNKAVSQYSAAQTFSFTASGTIYGFYLTENANDTLVYVERFASSRAVTSGTDINVTPRISLNNDAT